MRIVSTATVVSFLVVVFTNSVAAQTITEVQEIRASDPTLFLNMGKSVAMHGEFAVAGAPSTIQDGHVTGGAAIVFKWNGSIWEESQILVPDDLDGGDYFGLSCVVGSDFIAVSAYGDDDEALNAGAVYLYRYNGTQWYEERKLVASDAATQGWFGWSMAASGNVLAISALQQFDMAPNKGSTYVFRWDGGDWIEEQILVAAPTPGEATALGHATAISGDVIVSSLWTVSSGSAVVFRYSGSDWAEETRLVASDGVPFDEFGRGVAVDGDTIAVGALSTLTPGFGYGAAYLFRLSAGTWIEEQKISAMTAENIGFGWCVALQGDDVFVGAPWYLSTEGAIFHFRLEGGDWVEQSQWVAADSGFTEWVGYLGSSVAVHGLQVLGGAPNADVVGAVESGALYYYEVSIPGFFRRGDADGDGAFNVGDAITCISALFTPGFPALPCEDAGDANDDGTFDLADPVAILITLFFPGASPLPLPLIALCGEDTTLDSFDCDMYVGCP